MEFYNIDLDKKEQIKINLLSNDPPYQGYFGSMVMTNDGTIFVNNGSNDSEKPIFFSLKEELK